jgi:CDP-4-dehydro-6-deoxyglucose reductase, E3
VAVIHFEGRSCELLAGQTVLECLESAGVAVPSFCRSGACQICALRASGPLPAVAQLGLKDTRKQLGYFLSCVCKPDHDLIVTRPDAAEVWRTQVVELEMLSTQVLRVLLDRPKGFEFEAGQFVQLIRPSDGLMRPYSIASLPSSEQLELHVAVLPGGQMSQWLEGALGQTLELRGPFGECVYLPAEPERPLLLAGTGTGLAPLLGVLRAALAAGHRGPIHLLHGALDLDGLYMWSELCALQARTATLTVTGSVLRGGQESEAATSAQGIEPVMGALDALALASPLPAAERRVYLCGHPELVRTLRRKLYLAGTPLQRIHADPFLPPKAAGS